MPTLALIDQPPETQRLSMRVQPPLCERRVIPAGDVRGVLHGCDIGPAGHAVKGHCDASPKQFLVGIGFAFDPGAHDFRRNDAEGDAVAAAPEHRETVP